MREATRHQPFAHQETSILLVVYPIPRSDHRTKTGQTAVVQKELRMIPATMVTVPQATLAQVGRTDERHFPLEMLAVGQRDEVFA